MPPSLHYDRDSEGMFAGPASRQAQNFVDELYPVLPGNIG